jgi:hypothetical protein
MTRGSLLQRIAVAPIAIGAFAALAAEADAKAPQNAVMYQDKPKDGKSARSVSSISTRRRIPRKPTAPARK